MPSKKKQNEARKVKEEGRRESEKKKDCSVTLKPKNYLKILLPAHARTLQADIILHLEQKVRKCSICEWLCGKFWLFTARQWPDNGLTKSFKPCFSAKFPGAKWIKQPWKPWGRGMQGWGTQITISVLYFKKDWV